MPPTIDLDVYNKQISDFDAQIAEEEAKLQDLKTKRAVTFEFVSNVMTELNVLEGALEPVPVENQVDPTEIPATTEPLTNQSGEIPSTEVNDPNTAT